MIISTTNFVSGYEIIEVLDIARGSTVRARNIGRDIFAGLKNIIGGEITEYTRLLAEAREDALERMINDGHSLGADAIINVRFTTSAVMAGCSEILAYGTAVKLK
ncbi:MAG: YbjQ family protein [Saprospiraceae bacterium]